MFEPALHARRGGGGGGGGALTWVLDVWKVYIGVWEPAKVSPYSPQHITHNYGGVMCGGTRGVMYVMYSGTRGM